MARIRKVAAGTLLVAGLGVALSACGGKSASASQNSDRWGAGEQIFNKNCKVCHAQAINGAPILGNAAMWEKRIGQGKATLVRHAMEGFGLMPPKGGNAALTEQDIDSAVSYMLSQLKK